MKYNNSMIERSLKIWGFDFEAIVLEKLQHVPMHQFRIATKDKPLLYIDNLQCCIGLYAYGNNFFFAAHINTVVFAENEYAVNENKKPIHCNRCDDLYNAILNHETIVYEPFKIGIAIGSRPLDKQEQAICLIYQGIEDIIEKLNYLGISVVKLPDIQAPEFILDTSNEKLILPNISYQKKYK